MDDFTIAKDGACDVGAATPHVQRGRPMSGAAHFDAARSADGENSHATRIAKNLKRADESPRAKRRSKLIAVFRDVTRERRIDKEVIRDRAECHGVTWNSVRIGAAKPDDVTVDRGAIPTSQELIG